VIDRDGCIVFDGRRRDDDGIAADPTPSGGE
jgi:hypothetical protein